MLRVTRVQEVPASLADVYHNVAIAQLRGCQGTQNSIYIAFLQPTNTRRLQISGTFAGNAWNLPARCSNSENRDELPRRVGTSLGSDLQTRGRYF